MTARLPPPTFRQSIISGTAWNLAANAGGQTLSIVLSIVLMRILTPSIFGLMGMAALFTGFAAAFGDFGFSNALIQGAAVREGHFTSVFWLNLLMGGTLSLLFILIAPLVSGLFASPILFPLTVVLSLNFLIASPGWVPLALLQKRLAFKPLALIDLSAVFISGMVAIGMALGGFQVWSLAGQTIAFSLTRSLLLWRTTGWRPRGRFEISCIRELMAFGTQTTIFTVGNYWIRNADNFIVGKTLGSEALGLYNRSYNLMLMPLTIISGKIGAILFPAFSAIQTERRRIADVYLRTVRLTALLTFPMMAGMWLCADVLVLSLFGAQWRRMIPLLQILALVGAIESIGTLNGSIYLSQGKARLRLQVLATVGPLAITAIVVGSRWGVRGVATAYATYSLLVTIPSMAIPLRLIGLTIADVGRHLGGVTSCSLAMGAVVWIFRLALPPTAPPLLRLIILSGTGLACYVALVWLSRLAAGRDMLTIIREQWRKPAPPARQTRFEEQP